MKATLLILLPSALQTLFLTRRSARLIRWSYMEQIAILDPDYMYYVEHEADYRKKYMQRLRRSARPHRHYFRCKPTAPNSKITITATDRFGRVYTEEI